MRNHIHRKSVGLIGARLAVKLGIVVAAALLWQHLSEPNAPAPGALQPIEYAYVAYSIEDIWHAFPVGH